MTELLAQKNQRIIIEVPVRHGKSETISWWGIVWWLRWRPWTRALVTSYSTTFASRWGRAVRNTIDEHSSRLGISMSGDSTAVDEWSLAQGGGMLCRGTGNPPTGSGFALIDIDDPIADWEQANSQTYRDKTWEWFKSDVYTRLEPGGHIIVTMARWHEDDLVGRLKHEMNSGGERWEVINIPAIAEENDAIGRAPGSPLWPERYDAERLGVIKKTVGSYVFGSLYQQRPTPEGGGRFKRSWFKYYDQTDDHYILGEKRIIRANCWKFGTCDLAMSAKEGADWTVAALWAVTQHNDLILVDIWRERAEAPDVNSTLRALAVRWGVQFMGIEKAHYGAAMIQDMQRTGFPVRELIADRDKVTRSMPASVRMENGLIWFPRKAAWLDEYERELLGFPNAAHDDQVDVTSYAAIVIKQGGNWIEHSRVSESAMVGMSLATGDSDEEE